MRQLAGERRRLLDESREYMSPASYDVDGRTVMLTATERYYVRIGSRLYAVDSVTASHAIIETLAGIGDRDTWPDECEVWNYRDYHNQHGEPAEMMTVFRRYLKDGTFELITEDEARQLKMRRKSLGYGIFALITEDEARREYGVNWLSHTYSIYPESMPEGRRALLDRMQSGGPGRFED